MRRGRGISRKREPEVCPFEKGTVVEMKSFKQGFKGAWFHTQILDVQVKRRKVFCEMHHLEFGEEGEEIMLYENEPVTKKRTLMLRPLPPRTVKESDVRFVDQSEIHAIYNNWWKAGDLVDYWCDYCWWTGKIKRVLGDGTAQIMLPSPPVGEGGEYIAKISELRPTLNWSLENSWTAPQPQEKNSKPCVRVVVPEIKQGKATTPPISTARSNNITVVATPTEDESRRSDPVIEQISQTVSEPDTEPKPEIVFEPLCAVKESSLVWRHESSIEEIVMGTAGDESAFVDMTSDGELCDSMAGESSKVRRGAVREGEINITDSKHANPVSFRTEFKKAKRDRALAAAKAFISHRIIKHAKTRNWPKTQKITL